MRITADAERCIGAGQCVMSVPEVFEQDDEGFVTVITENPQASLVAEVTIAAERCPVKAIALHGD
jgi:ferredoxin